MKPRHPSLLFGSLFVEYHFQKLEEEGCGSCGKEGGCCSHSEKEEKCGCGEKESDCKGGCEGGNGRSGKVENDNREELFAKFRLEFSEVEGRFGPGYHWFCKKCGGSAKDWEEWFACQKRFVTIRVYCPECHEKWYLEIRPVPRRLSVETVEVWKSASFH